MINFQQARLEGRSNAKVARFAVRDEIERALDAGSFRLTDAWDAGPPWSVFTNEVLTDTVGRSIEPFSIRESLRIRVEVIHPIVLNITRRGVRSKSVPGETEYAEVLRPLARGAVVLSVSDAIGALVEHGVGVADKARSRRHNGAPIGALVETGYEWQGQTHDTTTPAMRADIDARIKASDQWLAEEHLRRAREQAAKDAILTANRDTVAALAKGVGTPDPADFARLMAERDALNARLARLESLVIERDQDVKPDKRAPKG